MSDQLHPHSWIWENLDSYLSRKQLKQTKQRKIIVEHFLQMQKHVEAEDLHAQVRDAGHNIGLATIYRTLNLLKEAELVEQRAFSDGRSVFELILPGSHHDHLVCIQCNTVFEFHNDQIEVLQEEIAKQSGFKLTSHRHDLFGYCSDCSHLAP